MSALEDIVRLEGVRVNLDGIEILRGLDLRVAAGEILGLLGPNGAGKTTLVRLLSGVVRSRAGTALLEGRSLASFPPRELARTVAVVPQGSVAPFAFLVEELVLMGRSPHVGRLAFEGEKDRRVVRDALAATHTTALAHREIGSLSGGERQRVLIARALAQEPRLLLLDEPTTFLDLRHQVELYRLLVRLNRERGLSVLVVSHDLNLAARYCHRIALLRDGRVAAQGLAAEVLTAGLLREVYDVDVSVVRSPDSPAPYILPREPRNCDESGQRR